MRRQPSAIIGQAAPDLILESIDEERTPSTNLAVLLSRRLPTFLVFYTDCWGGSHPYLDETDALAAKYANSAIVALVNTHDAPQASKLAARKQLSRALHFACSQIPQEYAVGLHVPHRVVIGGDGRVAHNLNGLQGLGVLPSRMPALVATLALQPPPPSSDHAARIERVRRIQVDAFADDVVVSEAMELEMGGSWSDEALQSFFESGGVQMPKD